ncbi:MAG: helix-turn-helix domain-containing protein [Acutalibacteraceae bacterium]
MKAIRFGVRLRYSVNELQFVSITRIKGYRNDFEDGKELHSFIYTSSGQLYYDFREGHPPIETDSGTLCFIPRGCPYSSEYREDGTHAMILMFDFADEVPPYLDKPLFIKSRQITALFARIAQPEANPENILCAVLYELLHIIESNTEQMSEGMRSILPARREIEKNYFENRKVAYYAQLCGMSESNFRRLFVKITGKSPIAYRNDIRLAEALKLIASGECTVEEAVYLVGFNNMSFFYELYRRYFGTGKIRRY